MHKTLSNIFLRNNIFIILLLALFYTVCMMERIAQFPKTLTPHDTYGYISEALFIKENGGIFHLPRMILDGEYRYLNRQPLFLCLLSFFAERNLNFLLWARITNIIIGFFTIAVLYLLVWRIHDSLTAFISCFLLTGNSHFLDNAVSVNVEPLFMIFICLAVTFTVAGCKKSKYIPGAGLFNGLAFLAKSSGILLLVPYMFMGVYREGKKFINRKILLYMIPFILIITPYMMISYNVFKSPMTNENSTLLWLDSFEQGYSIKNSEDIPDFRSYIESHDVGDIFGRLLKGMGFQISMLFLSTATVSFFTGFSPFVTPLTGLAIGAMFLYGYTKCRNREFKIYTVFMIIIFLILLGWITDVISGQRYQLPLLTVILPFSAHGLVILTEKIRNRIRVFHRIGMKLFLGIPVMIIMLISGIGIIRSTPYAEITLNRPTNAFNLLSKWAEDHIEKGQVYYGPMFEYHFQLFSEKIREKSFTYPIPIAKAFRNDVRKGRYTLPLAKDIGELNDFLRDNPASYIILSAFEILYPPGNFLAEYFRWHIDADNKFVSEENKMLRHFYFMNDYYASVKAYLGVHLEQVKDMPGLELVYRDPNPPVEFFVFKVKLGQDLSLKPHSSE